MSLSFLEGSTNCLRTACGKAGSYGNLSGCTISVTVVINTVFHIAGNTLNVLRRLARGATALLFSVMIVHFPYLLVKNTNIVSVNADIMCFKKNFLGDIDVGICDR